MTDIAAIYTRWTRAVTDPEAAFHFMAEDVPQLFREIAELRNQLERCEAEREAKGASP